MCWPPLQSADKVYYALYLGVSACIQAVESGGAAAWRTGDIFLASGEFVGKTRKRVDGSSCALLKVFTISGPRCVGR